MASYQFHVQGLGTLFVFQSLNEYDGKKTMYTITTKWLYLKPSVINYEQYFNSLIPKPFTGIHDSHFTCFIAAVELQMRISS